MTLKQMPNYKSKNYAVALVDALLENLPADKAGKISETKIADNFVKLLEKNHDIKKSREILRLAEGLYFKKTGKKKIILETAREGVVNSKVLKNFGIKGSDVVEEKINPKIIAGVKITVQDRQLDLSLLKKLDNLF